MAKSFTVDPQAAKSLLTALRKTQKKARTLSALSRDLAEQLRAAITDAIEAAEFLKQFVTETDDNPRAGRKPPMLDRVAEARGNSTV